jgi:hypothetical protein
MSDEENNKKSVRMNEMFELPVIEDMVQSPIVKLLAKVAAVVDSPVTWIRG